jgi:hypothetical protein
MLKTLGERVVVSYIMTFQYICHSHTMSYLTMLKYIEIFASLQSWAKFVTLQHESYQQQMLTMCFVFHIQTF